MDIPLSNRINILSMYSINTNDVQIFFVKSKNNYFI